MLTFGLLVLLAGCKPEPPVDLITTNTHGRLTREVAAQVAELEAREQKINETVWAKEILAQKCGPVVEALWNELNRSSNKLSALAAFPVGRVQLGLWGSADALPHGIKLRRSSGVGASISGEAWQDFIERFQHDGWELTQAEFRHTRFETDQLNQPATSRFYVSLFLTNGFHSNRATVDGELEVSWTAKPSPEPPAIKSVDASGLTIKQRSGAPAFELIPIAQALPERNTYSIGPLLLYDLDGDGFSEIIIASNNVVYRRAGENRYEPKPLFRHPLSLVSAAVVGDFDGDGLPDFLCESLGSLLLFSGSAQGTFETPSRVAWSAVNDLKYAMVLTCGDIDGDGDLDVFLGQYKLPYEGGQMPTPHYDANDGYPAYLLLNDGHGRFRDITADAGLAAKRWRRSFSASLVDLNRDGNLDLVVVSDFAGLDVHEGDGRGHFLDVTRAWFPESHSFGMAHTFGDFNADGLLDLLMIGMPSPTADRLEHLRLFRSDTTEPQDLRARMTFGNRLYFAKPSGGFEQTTANASIARSGWSWGCSAFDVDNDGYPEVYIANGMESRESVADYEGEYWLHDIYAANSQESAAAYVYLQSKVTQSRGRGESHGGYEKNRFYLNQSGNAFLEVAYLFGVALELDSRNVVSDDLDADGRIDLLVTSFEPWPQAKQTLRLYRNVFPAVGHWIGFRFREAPGRPVIGTQVSIRTGELRSVRQIVAGDSHRSQHAAAAHFGIGDADHVDEVEIRWPGGEVTRLQNPAIDRYYRMAR